MLRAYKYRIFPDDLQKEQLAKSFGCVRFIYNLGLETKIAAWTSAKKHLTHYDLDKELINLKADAPWLKDCPSQAIQASLRNLDGAYTNFFKRGAGFPKYKSKHRKQSISLPQGVRLSESGKEVFIPKLKWVGIDLHRQFKGEIKTVVVSRTTTNKYFASILVDTGKEVPTRIPMTEQTAIGLDLGIKSFAVASDGKKYENKGFLKSSMRQLRIEQRSLARKIKGSNHHKKQRVVVALLHERVGNQRRDFLHKLSRELVDAHDTICIEDLSVSGMSRRCKPKKGENGKYISSGQAEKKGINRAILDAGWSEFRSMLEYKAEWAGKNISVIGRFDPSSKMCSCCGKLNRELTLKEREWTCKGCNTLHDRDVNAAVNIKNFGLRDKPSVSQREALACA